MTRSLAVLRLASALALFVAAAACGSDDAPGGTPALRPVLTADRAWQVGESALVTRLPVPVDLAGWDYDAVLAETETRPEEEGGHVAAVLGSDTMRILRIPLGDDVAPFNQVRCALRMGKHSSVAADLMSEGRLVLRTPYAMVIGSRDAQEITIDLPAMRVLDQRPDELVLRFAGGARIVRCWDIRLMRRPWESWAQDIVGRRGRPAVDEVAREAVAISTSNPLSTQFDAPDGARMRFAFAPMEGMTLPAAPTDLVMRLTAGDATVERRFPLQKGQAQDARWTAVEVDLADFGGARVSADFALDCTIGIADYALVGRPTVYRPKQDPRTVVFVTSDTHRADHIAAANSGVEVATPILDALAERGVLFEDCYSSTNITVPSHVALLTATPPRDTMVLDNMSAIAEEARTLADGFRAAGFATVAAVSGSQLQDAWSGLGQGFDAMASPKVMTWDGAETADRLLALMAESPDRDLFVWLHLFDAHRPYRTEAELLDMYWTADDAAREAPLIEIPRGVLSEREGDIADGAFLTASYRAEVSYLDRVLARVFDTPRVAAGWVAVTADHGECHGEYSVWWNHEGLYHQNLAVPLILAGPGVPAGARVRGPVEHLDVGRTLLDLAGLDEAEFPGESLLRHIEVEPRADTPRFALASEARAASVRMGDWHCIVNLRETRYRGNESAIPEHSVELFDLGPNGDPLNDVASVELDRARRMRALVLDWLGRQRDTGWVRTDQANDAERMSQVEALGYTVSGSDGRTMWIDPACTCEFCELYRER